MADSSLMPAIIGLVGTTIGAVLGFGGGLITQLALERKKQAADEKKRKGEKLEELAFAFSDYQHWLLEVTISAQQGHDTWETIMTESPPISFSKVEAISLVYFPELRDCVRQFKEISSEYVRQLEHDKEQATKIIAKCKEASKRLERSIMDYAEHNFLSDKTYPTEDNESRT